MIIVYYYDHLVMLCITVVISLETWLWTVRPLMDKPRVGVGLPDNTQCYSLNVSNDASPVARQSTVIFPPSTSLLLAVLTVLPAVSAAPLTQTSCGTQSAHSLTGVTNLDETDLDEGWDQSLSPGLQQFTPLTLHQQFIPELRQCSVRLDMLSASYLFGQCRHADLVLRVWLQLVQGDGEQVCLRVLHAAVQVGVGLVADRPVVDPVGQLVLRMGH